MGKITHPSWEDFAYTDEDGNYQNYSLNSAEYFLELKDIWDGKIEGNKI